MIHNSIHIPGNIPGRIIICNCGNSDRCIDWISCHGIEISYLEHGLRNSIGISGLYLLELIILLPLRTLIDLVLRSNMIVKASQHTGLRKRLTVDGQKSDRVCLKPVIQINADRDTPHPGSMDFQPGNIFPQFPESVAVIKLLHIIAQSDKPL